VPVTKQSNHVIRLLKLDLLHSAVQLAASLTVQAGELRLSPQSIKQQKLSAIKRASHQAASSHIHLTTARSHGAAHLEQQLGSMVSVAGVQTDKERDGRKHRKPHRQSTRQSQHKRRGDADSEADEDQHETPRRKDAAESMAESRKEGPDRKQSPDRSSSSSDGGSSSSGTGSKGSITQFTRVLKINYEGAAADTGVASDPSLAGVRQRQAVLAWHL
jgi:hypothetical protein